MVRQTKLASTSPEAAHMAAGLGAGLLASLVTQVILWQNKLWVKNFLNLNCFSRPIWWRHRCSLGKSVKSLLLLLPSTGESQIVGEIQFSKKNGREEGLGGFANGFKVPFYLVFIWNMKFKKWQGRGVGWVCQGPRPENAAKKCDGRPRLDPLREDHHLSQAQVEKGTTKEVFLCEHRLYEKITTSQAHMGSPSTSPFGAAIVCLWHRRFPSSCQIKAGLFFPSTNISKNIYICFIIWKMYYYTIWQM